MQSPPETDSSGPKRTDTAPLEPPRLVGESPKAYGLLLAYCRMGPQRTLADLGRRFGRTPESYGFHARRWNWRERVGAYDAAVQAADERLLREEREAAERLRLRRQLEARQTYWDLSQRLLVVAERMLTAAEQSQKKWSYANICRLTLVAERLMAAAVEPLPLDRGVMPERGQLVAGSLRLYREEVEGDLKDETLPPGSEV